MISVTGKVVIIFVACSPEGICFISYCYPGYLTFAVTFFFAALADKRLFISNGPAGQLFQIKILGFNLAIVQHGHGLQSNPEGSHQPRLRRDYNFTACQIGHCRRNRFIVAYASLHKYLLPHSPVPFNPV